MSKDKNVEPKAIDAMIEAVSVKQGKKRKRTALKNEEAHAAPAAARQDTGKKANFKINTSAKSHVDFEENDAGHVSKVKKHAGPETKSKSQEPRQHTKSSSTSQKTRQPDKPSSKHSSTARQLEHRENIPHHLIKKRDALLPVRKALPIWSQADTIKASLKKNNVLVLTGETGSGKSTQVPQFLHSEPWCSKCIAITQPRRVAAISLARRVAEEMGSFMGSQSPTAKVGYSVRFDNATGPGTKVKFLTEGMLLQEMLRDPAMSQYSAIVVDEVHERSVNVDLILGFLKNLFEDMENGAQAKRKDPLKVVIMSATADVESLVEFFGSSQTLTTPGKDSKVERQISTCFVEGRQYPVKTTYLPEPTQDWVEAALKIIFQVHYKEPLPGDILVFLTGQDTIEGLEKLINDYAEGMDKDVPRVS
jgi:ATP-dependent RNA helicase DHR2